MTTDTLVKKLTEEVGALKEAVRDIKRTLLLSSKDPEGEYRASFVEKMISREREEAPYRFTTKEDFFRQLHGRKSKRKK